VIVVSDATPLIALAKIGQLRLLQELFGGILIPRMVYDEVVTNSSGRPGADEIRLAEWITIRSPADQNRVAYLRDDLDAGEAEALVLADELNADWILLDETKARLAAEFLGLHFIGTVGVLLLAKRMGKLNAIRPLLEQLRAEKFHISEKMVRAVLDQGGGIACNIYWRRSVH
jgi:predicted nucleic acid-binding protein